MTRNDLIRLARKAADPDVDVEDVVDRMIERMERERQNWERIRQSYEEMVVNMAADCIEAALALRAGHSGSDE